MLQPWIPFEKVGLVGAGNKFPQSCGERIFGCRIQWMSMGALSARTSSFNFNPHALPHLHVLLGDPAR